MNIIAQEWQVANNQKDGSFSFLIVHVSVWKWLVRQTIKVPELM